MENEKKNKAGKFIKYILLVLGTGALARYFIIKENRQMAGQKAKSLFRRILQWIPKKKHTEVNENSIDKLPGIPKIVFDRVMK